MKLSIGWMERAITLSLAYPYPVQLWVLVAIAQFFGLFLVLGASGTFLVRRTAQYHHERT